MVGDGALVERASVAVGDLADAEHWRSRVAEDVFESLAPFDKRLSAEVDRPRAQHVERNECRPRPSGLLGPAFEMDAPLQVLKTGGLTFGVERDDLAVEDERLFEPLRPRAKGSRDLWKLTGLFVAEARPQSDAAAPRRDFSNRANAVVLRFVDEFGIDQRHVGERREHRSGNRRRGHASIMTRRLQFSFGLEPVVEIRAVTATTLEIALVGTVPDVVFSDFTGMQAVEIHVRRLSAVRVDCAAVRFSCGSFPGGGSGGAFRHDYLLHAMLTLIRRVAIIKPGLGAVRIAAYFPEALLILGEEFDLTNPFRALPRVQLRRDHSAWSAVLWR